VYIGNRVPAGDSAGLELQQLPKLPKINLHNVDPLVLRLVPRQPTAGDPLEHLHLRDIHLVHLPERILLLNDPLNNHPQLLSINTL
jgi:hypothetical protein